MFVAGLWILVQVLGFRTLGFRIERLGVGVS